MIQCLHQLIVGLIKIKSEATLLILFQNFQ